LRFPCLSALHLFVSGSDENGSWLFPIRVRVVQQ